MSLMKVREDPPLYVDPAHVSAVLQCPYTEETIVCLTGGQTISLTKDSFDEIIRNIAAAPPPVDWPSRGGRS